MQETEKIWMNGELVDWADARVHVGAHGLHYGTGVFEGIRCYDTERGPAVFRLQEHLVRLHTSAGLIYMELPYSVDELRAACFETIGVNGLDRVLPPADRVLRVRRAGRAHGDEPGGRRDHELAMGRLSRRGQSTARHSRDDLVLAARRAEHDSARVEGDRRLPELDARDARGAPLGLRRGDHAERQRVHRRRAGRDDLRGQGRRRSSRRICSASILPGITRNTLIQIAQDLGHSVVEKPMIRSDLYIADEVFMAGTAVEVTPVNSVDDHEIGVGPVTLELQKAYADTVTGLSERWAQWVEYVPAAKPA